MASALHLAYTINKNQDPDVPLIFMHQSKNLIFIVDDDPDDRQIILDAFLEHTNMLDYVFLEDGKELLDTLKSSEEEDYPSLIILDLNMPGMLGLQVLKEIRSNTRYSHIPIIVMTTSELNTDRKHSYELGANCFLTKPKLYTELIKLTQSIATIWLEDEVVIEKDDTIKL
jgi:two-component system response regulator